MWEISLLLTSKEATKEEKKLSHLRKNTTMQNDSAPCVNKDRNHILFYDDLINYTTF